MAEFIGQQDKQTENGLTAYVAEQTGVYEDNETERNNDRKVDTFDFEEKSPKTDFVLIVEGTNLHVVKVVLTLASPVFDKMLLSEFKENSCKELELPGKNLDDFKEFLRCIYPNTLTSVSDKNALSILPLVDEYQVSHLKIRCEMVLLNGVNSETPANELFQLLMEASLYNLRDLRERCVALASEKNREELDAANDNCPLPAETFIDIFRQLNTRLEAKIKEIETSEFEFKIGLLKEYLSVDMKTQKYLNLAGQLHWKETHVILTMDVVVKRKTETTDFVWGVPLTVTIDTVYKPDGYSVYTKYESSNWLRVGIINSGQNTICSELKVRYILVNRQPKGETITLYREAQFRTGSQQMIEHIKKMSEIEDANQGFVLGGKIGMIIQIYMSEPNVY